MRFMSKAVSILSGEFLLKWTANGGLVVVARSIITTALVYLTAIGLHEYSAPNSIFRFDPTHFATIVQNTVPWLGTIFAATYAAYYSRFAAQWTYLAGLYNQIMAAQVQAPWDGDVERQRVYSAWMAGFIEDAEELHLARKPMYASVIRSMLKRPEVARAIRHIPLTESSVSMTCASN